MKAETYRELIDDARKLVSDKKYKQATDIFVSPIYAAYAHRVNSNLQNVYLAGVSRTGKTRLAGLLSRHGYLVISMDEVREFYWSSSLAYQEVGDIDACRNAVYQVLNDYFPAGVCIEGSDVYFHAINRRQSLPGNHVLFVLGINSSAVLPKAVSMYKAAKNGYCRGLMTFQEAERIATVQSQMKESLVGVDGSRIHYLEMMSCVDAERSLKIAEQELLSVLQSQGKSEVDEHAEVEVCGSQTIEHQEVEARANEVGVKKMDEETFEECLKAVTAAHEQERDDLLLRVETLLKENERLKSALSEEDHSAYLAVADRNDGKTHPERALGLDFSLPEEQSKG